uniref:Hint domain-containing protein n=1 Tax=Acrobeloides nanus TaxID=290746 RepID=A0A914EBF5_9BILA
MDHQLVPTHIKSISTIKQKGIFAPLTTSGNILVNGVYTSCYSVSENYSLLKGVSQILHKFNDFLDYSLWSSEENSMKKSEIDIPFSTQILYELSRILVPDQKLFF